MKDVQEMLNAIFEPVLADGEALEGALVGSRSGFMNSKFVVVGVTGRRVIIQETDRKWGPKGEPLSLTAEDVASASFGGMGGADIQGAIMRATSVKLKIKTTAGEKVTLMMAKGGGPFAKLSGGPVQENGVNALAAWFERNGKS